MKQKIKRYNKYQPPKKAKKRKIIMLEKVYCVYNYWDMTILNGIAEYNYKKYYFNESNTNEFKSGVYELTLLNDYIFELNLENWAYWKLWLERYYAETPHPVEYAKNRKTLTVEEIFKNKNIEKYLIELVEKNYQNEIIINEYLKNTNPIYRAEGIFSGDINGINGTNVEWKNIVEI